MKFLVTGGAGFIGANFIKRILKKHLDSEIVCVDIFTYAGHMESPLNIAGDLRFAFHKADITDKSTMEKIFQKENPDVIVNFAAETHVDRSIRNPDIFFKTNVYGTQVLADLALKYKTKHFHQISTDEVYGDLPLDRPDLLLTEDNALCPSNPYSASKAAADLLLLSYYRTFGLSVTVSRCSNNYGAYQHPEKLIPLMITNALQNKPLPIYGTGENVRDWIYVGDHCKAVEMILEKGKAGEVYNIGGNNEMRNIDVVELILEQLEKPKSLITFVEDRKGHDLRYGTDASKIRTELGWKTETSFAEGLKKTVEWYMKNREWWERLLLN